MRRTTLATRSLAALLALSAPLIAAAGEVEVNVGASIKHIAEVATAPGQSRLNIIAEGAGKIVMAGETARVYAQCSIVDSLVDKEITEGVGDCEFKSADGGALYARFQTIPGY